MQNNRVSMDENGKSVFYLDKPIIWSQWPYKTGQIYGVYLFKNGARNKQNLQKFIYQWKAQDLTINKMCLFPQYDTHERNYKPVTCVFTHFELGCLTSYNILTEYINNTI